MVVEVGWMKFEACFGECLGCKRWSLSLHILRVPSESERILSALNLPLLTRFSSFRPLHLRTERACLQNAQQLARPTSQVTSMVAQPEFKKAFCSASLRGSSIITLLDAQSGDPLFLSQYSIFDVRYRKAIHSVNVLPYTLTTQKL